MHREFDASESPFQSRSHLALYLFTGFLISLLFADVWPRLSEWIRTVGIELPSWQTRESFGFRFSLIAAILGGARVLYISLERLAEGSIGADLSIAVACVAAILIGEPVVAAEVLVIGLIGECLEAAIFDRTQRSIRGLTELFPARCWVVRDSREIRVFTSDLVAGDRVVVKPGGKIPVDGTVLEGESTVDTSALTGESTPRELGPGDQVLAGCINQFGVLHIQTTKVAKATVAGQVIELTAAALKDKSRGERLADKLARYFLPVVLALSAITFAWNFWYQTRDANTSSAVASRLAIYPTLGVLVAACPCPLVLATPAAVIAALGRLAGTGVLIKGGSALEKLATVTGFAFDKTGTLTEGRPEVCNIVTFGSVTSDDVVRVAASAERGSEHPFAQAILSAAQARGLTFDECTSFLAKPGAGVSVLSADGATSYVGSRKYVEENGIDLSADVIETLAQFDDSGQSALIVASGGVVLGAVALRDRVRPEAAGVLTELKSLGIEHISLLTGDRTGSAMAVAKQLPFTDIHAELLPLAKAERVNDRFAFVGDGINDAPALAKATVGISVGSANAAAAAAGDVVMMGDPLRPLPLLLRLSRKTVQVIRQNIIWFGFGVNLVGVIIIGGLWPLFAPSPRWYESAPLAGVLYHQIGSLAVLLNSMRLLAFDRPTTSSTIRRWSESYRLLDRRVNTLNLDELLHESSHRWKPALAGVLGVVAVSWVISGLTSVSAAEVGVVQRFGAVAGTIAPGLHIRWPWPIELITKLKPAEVKAVEVGYRNPSEDVISAAAMQDRLRRSGHSQQSLTWASSHGNTAMRTSDESTIVTGDDDLIELQATAWYTINDPIAYLFNSNDTISLIRSVAESVLRELAAGRSAADLMTSERTVFEVRAYDKIRRRLAESSTSSLGVELTGLTIHDLHPPPEVVEAYHGVAEALQRRDQRISEAYAEATRKIRQSEVEALRTIRQAETAATTKLVDAISLRDVLLAWAEHRTTSPVEHGRLSDFRQSLDATVGILRNRGKIVIDADQLPGRRQMILFDPSASGLPLTLPRPAGRAP